MSQRLSLPCRLVKNGPSDNVQVRPNQMDARGKDKDDCGTVRMVRRIRINVCLHFFTAQAKFGSTGGLRMSSWSGKTGYGSVGSVVWTWFQPKLQSGRTQDGSVSLIGTVGWTNLSQIVQNVLISMLVGSNGLIHEPGHISASPKE